MANDSDEATLDRGPLDELIQYLGPDRLIAMIDKVPDALEARLADVRSAAGKPAEVGRMAAHRLKGLASTYGLRRIAALALAFESGDLRLDAPEAVERLAASIAAARTDLARFTSELRGDRTTGCI